MSYRQLAADGRDEVGQVYAMSHICEKRLILVINRMPLVSVHFRIVKKVALDSPSLAKDLCPLGPRIDQRFELRDVDGAIAHFCRAIDCYDPPPAAGRTASGRLVEQLLLVARHCV